MSRTECEKCDGDEYSESDSRHDQKGNEGTWQGFYFKSNKLLDSLGLWRHKAIF